MYTYTLVSSITKITVGLLITLLVSMVYANQPITIDIVAIVSEVDDVSGILGGKLKVNDIIEGSYVYDAATLDTNNFPSVGDYRHTTPPYGLFLKGGGFNFQTDLNNVDFLVEIVNNHHGKDNYLLRSYNNLPLDNGISVEHISWQLDDPSTTALSSTALPTEPPILDDWASIFGLTITGGDDISPFVLPQSQFFIRAHVISAQKQAMLIELVNFETSLKQGEIDLTWMTSNELNNAGYRLWRGTDDGSGGYTNITTLIGISSRLECAEGSLMTANLANTNHLIPSVGNSRENTCYFFSDTTITENNTYYYLLEDVDMDGKRTFHCDHIAAVTVGQGPTIDLKSATTYCERQTTTADFKVRTSDK